MNITLTSDTMVVYNNLLLNAKQASDVMFEMAELKTNIIYRRMKLNTGNLSGDMDKRHYTDYSIDTIVTLLLIDDRNVQSGEFKPGDCELQIKPYINKESDGTIITEPFEPQIDDEFWFQGIRFRIKLIRPEIIGETKVYLDCLCSRLENDNPQTEWNENYREPITNSRRGNGWD
ncbi:MAG: hypothetical protein EOL97_12890 [Spirochaetia bacterium]|nr:hypothetical protein [Spirochaetia bacterium]